MEPLDTVVVVETPEHVEFRYLLAGPSRRIAAYLIDTALRALVLGIAAFFASLLGKLERLSGAATGVLWLLAFALEWAYFVLFETLWDGQSPGKRAVGLRVVNAAGRPLGFVDSVLRNVLRAADFLPVAYALGFMVVAADRKFRRLGDFVGGTLVIAEERSQVEAPLPRLAAPTAAELAAVPAGIVLLPQEVEAIELFLRRRPRLTETRAAELAELAADAIGGRLGLRHGSAERLLELLYFRALQGSHALA